MLHRRKSSLGLGLTSFRATSVFSAIEFSDITGLPARGRPHLRVSPSEPPYLGALTRDGSASRRLAGGK
jgi:hypothetical protein